MIKETFSTLKKHGKGAIIFYCMSLAWLENRYEPCGTHF